MQYGSDKMFGLKFDKNDVFKFTFERRVYFSTLLFSAEKQIIGCLHALGEKVDKIEKYAMAMTKITNESSTYYYFLH